MVQIQTNKQNPKEDKTELLKSELLNSTELSEVQSEKSAICSAGCMFVSACLFILYLTMVILMSWIMRGYIYVHLKHFLRIDSIYDLNLQSSQNSYNSNINPIGNAHELRRSRPYPLEINIKPLENMDDEKTTSQPENEQSDHTFVDLNLLNVLEKVEKYLDSPQIIGDDALSDIISNMSDDDKATSQLENEQSDHTFLDLNLLNVLDNDEKFKDSPQIIGDDTLSDIIGNMSDFILNELEMVEESLKSDVEKLGDGTINMNAIDLFTDDIISNITHILEEEIKIIEDSLKSKVHVQKEFQSDNYAGRGFMGFLSDIFGQDNVRHESIEKSDVLESRQNEDNSYNSFSPRLEHRFDLQEPIPEPNNDHNYLESSENIILNKAVTSIRNLFGKNKNESPDVVKVLLKPEEQHIRYKVMLLEYLEIFGLVLAVMTFITFILFLIINRIIGFIDQREVIKHYKLQESIIIREKDQHVI